MNSDAFFTFSAMQVRFGQVSEKRPVVRIDRIDATNWSRRRWCIAVSFVRCLPTRGTAWERGRPAGSAAAAQRRCVLGACRAASV